jgi:hypothetical protein
VAEHRDLVNVFEVEIDGEVQHLVCFLEHTLGFAKGIDSREVIGRVTRGADGEFDLASLSLNPTFVETFIQYMNDQAARSPEIAREARATPSGWVYVIDPRQPDDPDADTPPSNIVGAFAVDDTGQVVPGSFQYNRNHLWFDPARGQSGFLSRVGFYNWLHSSVKSPI